MATLTGLLGRTPNLKKLALADLASEVFDHVLNGTKSGLLPMHLRRLDLTCTIGDRKDPYHPTNWSLLNEDLKSLNELALDLRSAETPTGRIKSKKEMPSYANITELQVGLPQKGRSSVLQLIACFPNLSRLHLSSTSPVPDVAGALSALQNPISLHELVLNGSPKKGWTVPDESEQLTSLHSLKLIGKWHRLASTDIGRICDLPLRRFELSRDSELCLQLFYEALQLGRLPNLQILHFDNLSCRVGREVDEDDLPWAWEDQIEVIRDAKRTWRSAKWTREFQLETFRALATLCKSRNIKIKGRIRRALHVEEELDAMREDIDELKSMIRMRGTGLYRGIKYGRSYRGDSDYDYDEDDYSDSWY